MAKGKEFLQELREFLAFLASLWGLLAAVSVFFPLSNLLTKVVPLGDQDKPFHNVSPGLVALLSHPELHLLDVRHLRSPI